MNEVKATVLGLLNDYAPETILSGFMDALSERGKEFKETDKKRLDRFLEAHRLLNLAQAQIASLELSEPTVDTELTEEQKERLEEHFIIWSGGDTVDEALVTRYAQFGRLKEFSYDQCLDHLETLIEALPDENTFDFDDEENEED